MFVLSKKIKSWFLKSNFLKCLLIIFIDQKCFILDIICHLNTINANTEKCKQI